MLPCNRKMEDTTPTEDVQLGCTTSNKYGALSERISSGLRSPSRISRWKQMQVLQLYHSTSDNGVMDRHETITETQLVPLEKACTRCTVCCCDTEISSNQNV